MSSGEHRMPSPVAAQTPRGVNHLVLNVRNMEASHRFWTEILGFRQVAELRPKPGRPPLTMRFYSGVDERGEVNHHDVALAEIPGGERAGAGVRSMVPGSTALRSMGFHGFSPALSWAA